MPTLKSYFICFTVRSGSTVLCELLARTNIAGKPQEHFNHNINPINPKGDTIPDYRQFISQTLANSTTPNGVFGTKIGGGVWHDFVRRLNTIEEVSGQPFDQTLAQFFPDLHFIWLTRRNKVRQAVSHWMAIQSGRWHSPDSIQNDSPQYQFNAIDHLVQELVIREAVWGDYFSQNNITPHIVVYEDFIRDMEYTVRGILNFLNIDIPAGFKVQPPHFQRTANTLSEAWVQRYREEKQADWWAKFW